jgi:CRP-like cAMP-binding protein
LQLGLADANLHRKQREKRRKIQPPRGKVMASSSAQLASSSYNPTNFATETSELIAFCNVPIGRLSSGNFAEEAAGTFPDLDTGLEWMEEKALCESDRRSASGDPVAFETLELVRKFDAREIATLRSILAPRDFAAGAILCREGDAADGMWIVTKGSLSVWLHHDGGQETRRIAGIGTGTTVGEMALLETAQRSATVTADSDVSSYELTKEAFDTLCRRHPKIALKIFSYFAHEMSYRLRITHRDLRCSDRNDGRQTHPHESMNIMAFGHDPEPARITFENAPAHIREQPESENAARDKNAMNS